MESWNDGMMEKFSVRRWLGALGYCVLLAFLFVSCSSLKFSQGIPKSSAGWPMFGRDASHTSMAGLPTAHLQKIWEFDAGAGFGDFSPIIENGIVFVSTLNGSVISIDITNGKKDGSKMFGGAIFSPPVVCNNMMVVASSESQFNLFGYNLVTGKVDWSKKIADVESAPVLFDSSIYVATVGGDIYRINPASGAELFHKHVDAPFRTSPALSDSICVAGCNDGYVYALSAVDGKELWRYNAGASVWCSASMSDSLVFVGTNAGKLLALTKSGKLSFEFPKPAVSQDSAGRSVMYAPGGKILSMPIADDKRVYFGCNDGNFYAINLSDGGIAWKDSTGAPIVASPVQTPGQIIFGGFDENLYVVDKTDGKIEQKIDLEGRVRTSPAIYKDYLVVCVENSKVVGLRIK